MKEILLVQRMQIGRARGIQNNVDEQEEEEHYTWMTSKRSGLFVQNQAL